MMWIVAEKMATSGSQAPEKLALENFLDDVFEVGEKAVDRVS